MKAVIGTDLPGSAVYAEHLAVVLVLERSAGRLQIVTDCAAAVATYQAEREAALDYKKPFAGLYKQANLEGLAGLRKTKAHRPKVPSAQGPIGPRSH